MMKKCLLCFLILMQSIIFMSGCKDDIFPVSSYDYSNPLGDKGLMGQIKAEEIIDYLKTGNSEALKEMFCKVLRDREDFDEKIDDIMNFIDGEIISYRNSGGAGGRGSTWERIYPNIKDIETDKSIFYHIIVHLYIEDENPDKLGICSFKIGLESDDRKESIDEVIIRIE